MAKKKSFFSRFRIVYRHSPVLLKCALLVTIVLSIAALTAINIRLDQSIARKNAFRVQAAYLEQENAKLDEKIRQKDTEEGIKTIAKEDLGMVEGDTILYDVITNQD